MTNLEIISIVQLVKLHGNIAMSVGVKFVSFILPFIIIIIANYAIIEL